MLLSTEQRSELEGLVRAGTVEHRLARRARMVLLRADGWSLAEIARQVGQGIKTVKRKLDRFLRLGMAGLRDRPKPGRPRKLSLFARSSC